jgi:hypothetical protein
MFDTMTMDNVTALLRPHLPIQQRYLLDVVRIDPALTEDSGAMVSRGAIAQALNILLLADLMERTPTAAGYVRDLETSGDLLVFDHGALRTIDLDGMGTLPSGRWAIARILEPLGYQESAVYPLDRLGMTGFSYTHRDFPETLPQFFVSELHVSRFSPAFQDAIGRVTWESEDPLDASAKASLKRLQAAQGLSMDEATALLPALVASFDRQHGDPLIEDYDLLLAESAEAAWIATEGNSFNHATNRVQDLRKVVAEQKLRGRAMKPKIEVSRSGRVQQTAYRADPVQRRFIGYDGEGMMRTVPGSFFEFIQRAAIIDENGQQRLDLRFDSGNAQGIFKMTAA